MTETLSAPRPAQQANIRDLLWIAGIAGIAFILDLLTKIWAVHRLYDGPPIEIIPGVFRFAYGENTGIAFGLLQNHGGLLHILSPVAFLVLIVILYKMFAQNTMDFGYRLIFGLLIGGAIGNILNRLYLGYVIDFIDVFIGTYNFPTFNIADSALTIGETILIARLILEEFLLRKKEAAQNQNPPES